MKNAAEDAIVKNYWVFLCQSVDFTSQKQAAMSYQEDLTGPFMFYENGTLNNSDNSPFLNAKIEWGGVTNSGGPNPYFTCVCSLQYFRLYLNYFPDNKDQMINLAYLVPESI